MMVDLLIQGGEIVSDGYTRPPSWVAVDGGKIVAMGSNESPPEAKKVIDASGKHVLPGVIDIEHHLVHPIEEGLFTETRAAAGAGITTTQFLQASMWLEKTVPVVNRVEDVPFFMEKVPGFIEMGNRCSMIDYTLNPQLETEAQVEEIPDLAEKYGITNFKLYLHMKSGEHMRDMWAGGKMGGFAMFYYDDGMIYKVMKKVAALGPPAILQMHCENWEIARVLKEELIAQGRHDASAWDDHSPGFCEAGHVRNYAYYAGITGCPIYIQHCTTRETIEGVRRAKAEGIKISAQCSNGYLSLTKDKWRVNVPLRSRENIDACWEALKAGIIDCIGSDHVGNPKVPEKAIAEIEKAGFKFPWDVFAPSYHVFASRAESMLPVLLSEGVNKGRISLERLVEVVCENNARRLGLYPKKGAIALGSDGDFTIVDLNKTKKLTRDQILSRQGWSIWEGWEFKGWPVMTILRGNIIMEWPEGSPKPKVADKPIGQYLPRQLGHELYHLD